ncbi:outer membrane beta-barrel protein [Jiella mangrovi]|uniref:Outer membrane beta-barrel protein n=1 Tax=Jiella mangrovi TaxID=2821407 RepID=A0ABS4BFQ6_9HYPH|nr:outer membrane beta-barrel protein [Jiella mangrovi]MBP0615598.1 outer membrane beta-barrel protein [Jiella mangrovi]
MSRSRGEVLKRMLLAAACAAMWPGPVNGQQLLSDDALRETVEPLPSETRLADPNADLIESLGADDQQTLTAPDEKGEDPARLRSVPDPASPDTTESDAASDDAVPTPRQSFDLDDGAPSLLSPDGPARSAQPSNTAATPLAADGASEDDARGVAADERTGTSRSKEDLPSLANPTLGAGIADEALPARSTLRSNQAAETVDRIRRLNQADDGDPFAPVGIRAGTFILYPELIQTIGFSNNLENDTTNTKGAFTETILSSRLVSDWSSNEAEFNSRLAYRQNFAGDAKENPSAAVDGRLRLDISHDTVATLRGAIDFDREDYSDVLDDTALSGRAGVVSSSLAAELSHDFHPVSVAGTLTVARKSYFSLPEGSIDEDYTTLTAALRAGYDLSPAIQPFVEASVGRRIFDVADPAERDGPGRNAWLPAMRAGVGIDLRDKLKGEVALGYAFNVPDDASVETMGALTVDANLVWSPRRGTDVTLSGRTSFEPELTGLSSTTNYETSLAIAHSLGARTTLTAAATLGYEDSTLENEDKLLLSGVAGFNYWLNRQLALTGSYEHRRSFAVLPGNRYSADTVKLGVTLQR